MVADGENVPARIGNTVSDGENVPSRTRNTVSDGENVPTRTRNRVSDGQRPCSAASSGFFRSREVERHVVLRVGIVSDLHSCCFFDVNTLVFVSNR